MTRKKVVRASRKQLIEIHEKLKEALVLPSTGEFVEFKEGWDDRRVAEVLGVSLSSVQGARMELFGKTRVSPRSQDPRIQKLEDELHELRVKYHKLVLMLALKQVADCRHLTLVNMEKNNGPALVATK